MTDALTATKLGVGLRRFWDWDWDWAEKLGLTGRRRWLENGALASWVRFSSLKMAFRTRALGRQQFASGLQQSELVES